MVEIYPDLPGQAGGDEMPSNTWWVSAKVIDNLRPGE